MVVNDNSNYHYKDRRLWSMDTKVGKRQRSTITDISSKVILRLQKMFSKRDAIIYFNRFDELIAITNGLSLEDHLSIEREINDLHKDLNISMSIGTGTTPLDANIAAYYSRKNNNLLNKSRL